jgi:hypothetical protein
MRQALIESIGTSTQDRYPKGSIVICTSCGHPIYRLERGVGVGESMGRARDAFAPVSPVDLLELRDRTDIDPGVRACVREMRAIADLRLYCDTIEWPVAGTPALCPKCDHVFVQARTSERSDTNDRAYVWELTTILPPGHGVAALRGGDLWNPR